MKDYKGAGGVIYTDSLDRLNPSQQPQQINIVKDWRNTVIMSAMSLFALVFFIGVHYWATIQVESDSIAFQRLGWFILIIMYFGIALLFIAAVVVTIFFLYNKAQQAGLVNVMQHQSSVDQIMRKGTQDRFYDVMQARMDHSVFQGVQNLTYSPTTQRTITGGNVAEQMHLQDLEADEIMHMPILAEMQSRGLIARSGESLLIGFMEGDENE